MPLAPAGKNELEDAMGVGDGETVMLDTRMFSARGLSERTEQCGAGRGADSGPSAAEVLVSQRGEAGPSISKVLRAPP